MERMKTSIGKNPNDKNAITRLTEKERMVLYPMMKTRYGSKLRDHDLVECNDEQCSRHGSYLA